MRSSPSTLLRLLTVTTVLLLSATSNGQRSYRRQGYSLINGEETANGEFWKCNLAMNACHFRNQYNLARFSRYHNPLRPFYNEASALVLDLASAGARKFPGARLISHYFPARRVDACLYISYLMTGSASRAFYVIQQDKENKCIYADENDVKINRWRHIQLQLNLADGDPRFFIEAQYDQRPAAPPQQIPFDPRFGPPQPQVPGYIALSKFSFKFGQCSRNDVNNCFADEDPRGNEDQEPDQNQNQNPPEPDPNRPVAPPPDEV